MPCYHPGTIYREPGGGITFDRSQASGLVPITISCGQCYGCRMENSRQWAVRLMHESQTTENGETCFITLTYDKDHLPSDHSLKIEHWQLFAKSLRHEMAQCSKHNEESCKECPPRQRLRFLHCGEYGEATEENDWIARPHYHAALFGIDFRGDREYYDTNKQGDKLYTSPSLAKHWTKGTAPIGDLTFNSAGYIARYLTGKRTGKLLETEPYEKIGLHHEGEVTQLKPPYLSMSNRPGLGHKWFTRFIRDVYPRDEIVSRGKPARPPKYYDRLLERLDPQAHAQLKAKRTKEGNKHLENNTPERLKIREELHLAKTRSITRHKE